MLVSVIIPNYNRQGPVQRALNSVLRQSFRDFEVIIVDDGSNDQSVEWLTYCKDPRLRIIKSEHGGVAKARNRGVEESKGSWICFLDSDDVWKRHKLSEQVRFHDKNREILFSQTDDIWIRDSVRVNKMKKHEVREGNIFKESLRLCLVCCSSVMLSKDLFIKVGGFDDALLTCEDYDLWLRLLVKYPVGFVDKLLVSKFGGHEDQLSKKFPMMDKYRLIALGKLLNNPDLDQEQKEWVKEEIQFKENIIALGAKKRT